jgi:hypothetical protein
VLNIVDPNNELLMCKDAYKEGLRGVIMQEGRVICHEFKKLNEHEIDCDP